MNASCRFQFSESLPEQVPADSPYSGSSHLPQIKESSEKQLKRQLPNVYYVFRITTREPGSFSYAVTQYFRGTHADLFRFQLAFRHYENRQGQKSCGEKLHFSLSDHYRLHRGCLYKITGKFDFVFWLYLLNGLLVATDTVLCLYYQHRNKKKAGLVKAEEQTV